MDSVSPTANVLRALELIQTRPGVTAAEIAERLDVSERAVRRYVSILREAGVAVDAIRGRHGGYRLGRSLRPPPLVFTAGEALAEIVSHVAPDETVAVLPEGVMLDYLARRSAGTKYITWMPPEVLFFGEAVMLADLAAGSPSWIVLAPRNLGEYGYRAFGDDYCVQAAQWIAAHYETAATWDDGRWRLMRCRASDPRGP